ncbi:MAG: alpha/beta fold hydrolase [Polyangia bacterium]
MNRITPALCFALLATAGCMDPDDSGNLVPKTVVEDPSLPHLEVNGALFHTESFGNPHAPTVMVLHGGPGADYRGLLALKALADDGYRVVFWDQRGAGLSQRFDAGFYTIPGYLDDLRQFVETTIAPEQPFVFIGHSWGGMYATGFINDHGDYGGRLRGAILSEPGGFNTKQLQAFIDREFGSLDLTGEQINDAAWAGQFLSPDDHARADYLQSLLVIRGAPCEHRDPHHPAPLWRSGAVVSSALPTLALEGAGFDFTAHLSAFKHKVLFLRGDRNEAATLGSQQELAADYPDAQVVTMAETGHEMVWERPDEYLAHARAYFSQIGFTAPAPGAL